MSKKDNVIQKKACESVAYIPLRISTPISLKPLIRKLPMSVEICGEPELTPTPCGTYILTQDLCVKVALEIDINSASGNKHSRPNTSPAKPKYRNVGIPNVIMGNNRSF